MQAGDGDVGAGVGEIYRPQYIVFDFQFADFKTTFANSGTKDV